MVPALALAAGMRRRSPCKGVNGRGRRHVLLSQVCNGVIRAQAWQQRFGRGVKVAISNVKLGAAAIVAMLVVLKFLIQFFFQGTRAVNRSVALDTLRLCLDAVQVLDTGFNRHRDTFRTQQWSWTIWGSRRKRYVLQYSTVRFQTQYATCGGITLESRRFRCESALTSQRTVMVQRQGFHHLHKVLWAFVHGLHLKKEGKDGRNCVINAVFLT